MGIFRDGNNGRADCLISLPGYWFKEEWYVRRDLVHYKISPGFSRQVANTARTTIRVFATATFNYVSLSRSKK